MTTPTRHTAFANTWREMEGGASGPMIGGGQVNPAYVKTSIRHSVLAGSAHIVYLGREEGRPGDILVPEWPDGNFLDCVFLSVQKALGYIQALYERIADAAGTANIVAITPLSADLARKANEVMTLLEAMQPIGCQEWDRFLLRLTRVEFSELEWQALGVAHRTYEKELRADFEGGNEILKEQARSKLHDILRALLRRFDPRTDFATKALPMIASICLALLEPMERAKVNDNLRAWALGQEAPHIDFGTDPRAFQFVTSGGHLGGDSVIHRVLSEEVYPFIKQKWLALRNLAASPASTTPQAPTRFLYLSKGKDGILGWQAAKPSAKRWTVYVSLGLAQQLAQHPLALAEILIEEVAHMYNHGAVPDLEKEEQRGKALREALVLLHKRQQPDLLTLNDLLPEVAGTPTLDVPWREENIARQQTGKWPQ